MSLSGLCHGKKSNQPRGLMESCAHGYLDTWPWAFVPGQRQQEQGHRKQKGFGWSFASSWPEFPLPPWVQELLLYLWAQEFSFSGSSHQMQLLSAWDQPCMGSTEYEGCFCTKQSKHKDGVIWGGSLSMAAAGSLSLCGSEITVYGWRGNSRQRCK